MANYGSDWSESSPYSALGAEYMPGGEADQCERTFPCEVALAEHYQSHYSHIFSIASRAEAGLFCDAYTPSASVCDRNTNSTSPVLLSQNQPYAGHQTQFIGVDDTIINALEPSTLGDGYYGTTASSHDDIQSMAAMSYDETISDTVNPSDLAISPSHLDVIPTFRSSLELTDDPGLSLAFEPKDGCKCIVCHFENGWPDLWRFWRSDVKCLVAGCSRTVSHIHEMNAVVYLPQLRKYYCIDQKCHSSFKRPSDLLRHTRAVHCLNPGKFPCNAMGCRYGGDNGFTRKDKLKSHQKKVHQNNATPKSSENGTVMRAILPRVQE